MNSWQPKATKPLPRHARDRPLALDCAEAARQLRYEGEAAFSREAPNTPMAGLKVRVISERKLHHRAAGRVDGKGGFQRTGVVRKMTVTGIQRGLDTDALVLNFALTVSRLPGSVQSEHGKGCHLRVATALKADKLLFMTSGWHSRAHKRQRGNPIVPNCPWPSTQDAGTDAAQLKNHRHGFYLQHCIKACEAAMERNTSFRLPWMARCC